MVRNLLAVLLAAATSPAFATLAYSTPGSTTSQSFNSLGTSWSNDTTLDGWYAFNSSNAAVTSILSGTGSGNQGGLYSFGTASSDRALGGVGSGSFSGNIAFGFNNSTGQKLDVFTVKYDGEQWRNGGNTTAQTMVFQYGIGATFGAVTTWATPGAAFSFTSPVATATAAALDGNAAPNRTANKGGVIYIPTGLAAGQTLWLRWVETNDAGNDHGLAIDNFSISAIPEPTAALFGSLLAGAFGLTVARRPAGRE